MSTVATAKRSVRPMRPPSERSRLRAVPYPRSCGVCRRAIPAGKVAWFAKESPWRCEPCGRHDGSDDLKAVDGGCHVMVDESAASRRPRVVSIRKGQTAKVKATGFGPLTERYRPLSLSGL